MDIYASVFPSGNKEWSARLDDIQPPIVAPQTHPVGVRGWQVNVNLLIYGAGEWNRTTDLRFTKPLLCQLSYAGFEMAGEQDL